MTNLIGDIHFNVECTVSAVQDAKIIRPAILNVPKCHLNVAIIKTNIPFESGVPKNTGLGEKNHLSSTELTKS